MREGSWSRELEGEGAKETEEVSGENKESIVSSLREGQEIYRGKKKKTREEVISGVAGCSSRKKLKGMNRASPGITLDSLFVFITLLLPFFLAIFG